MRRFIRYNLTYILHIALALVLISCVIIYLMVKPKDKAAAEPMEPTDSNSIILSAGPEIPEEQPVDIDSVLTRDYFDVPLSQEIQDIIFVRCELNNLEPELIISMIDQESDFRPQLMGDGGDSYGLMQIQPKHHYELMSELGCTDLLNPADNVTVGIEILSNLLKDKNNTTWALMAYNGGPSYATRKINRGEVSNYATEVINRYNQIKDGNYQANI